MREIDALGGVMGEVADATGIQFRLLNTSRGPAVWSPRAQMDKKQYRIRMREVLEAEPNLRILQAEVAEMSIEEAEGRRRVAGCGCETGGAGTRGGGGHDRDLPERVSARRREQVQLRTERRSAGEPAGRSACGRLGLAWKRLKTGTPPRLDGRTIEWSAFEAQPGDAVPTPFSFLTEKIERKQIQCHVAYTTEETHADPAG